MAIISIFWSYQSHSQQAPNIQWQNTIGGNQEDYLWFVTQTMDKGFICGGHSDSNTSADKNDDSKGGHDYWVVKLDSTGSIQWQKTIGGSGNDSLRCILQTTDGGYICGGFSNSNISGDKTENSKGEDDYWVVKLDSVGNIMWQNTIGGNQDEWLEYIIQTSDGGYFCGGSSESNISGDKNENSRGLDDFWIVKLDSMGVIEWQRTLGGSSWDFLWGHVAQTADDGYILGGQSWSDISGDKTENSEGKWDYWIIKLDTAGTIQWQSTIGGNQEDWIRSIQQTNDNGYIVGGTSFSDISGDKTENRQGVNDYWVLKLDSIGNIQWQNTIGGGNRNYFLSIDQCNDGGFICGGRSNSDISGDKNENSRGGYDYWIVKVDSLGVIVWQKTIGGSQDEWLESIEQTVDGGFICGGFSNSNISGDKSENSNGGWDYWIVKIELGFTTSIPETPSPSFSISPNPTRGQVQVNFLALNTVKAEVISVYSLEGKKVHEVTVQNQEQEVLNIETLSSGTYLVQVSFEDNSTWSKKIQKID